MKRHLLALFLAASMGAVTGCDWSSGGGSDNWNSRYNFVNFSGVYRGRSGIPLVSDFTGVADEDVSITGEAIDSGDGVSTAFAGALDNSAVIEGTITITGAGYTFRDTDGDGTLVGEPAGSGSIIYGTGSWSIDFDGFAPAGGVVIRASYVYEVKGTSAGPGSSGGTIDSLTIFHEGEHLRITDNQGSVYEGKFGSMRSTGGNDTDSGILTAGDIIGQFNVKGVNAADLKVTITGTFTGVITDGGSQLGTRVIEGTYIEDGGRTGDVLGIAPNIGISQGGDITIPGEVGGGGDGTT